MRGEKILVAMSGGVDSSVAAHLLKEQGYEPVGVFMRSGVALRNDAAGRPRCCSVEDASDARRVAGQLGIPFYVLNFAEDFGRLIDRFCEEYGRGRTPNPCILCNRDLKFGRLFRYADALGAKCVATGHYARVEWPVGLAGRRGGPVGPSASPGGGAAEAGLAGRRGGEAGRWRLARGVDARKDQSYVLFPIPPERLERIRLPLGERTKQETRTIARELGLAVRDKPESQEICFVTGTIEALVRERRPDLVRPGPVLDLGGKELGRHGGIVNFTIGQRRGLGIALGEPMYVVAIRPQDAAIVVGPASALRAKGLVAEEVVWHEAVPAEPVRAEVQIRYRHAAAGAWVERLEGDRAAVRFDEPQAAVTPGQAAVFYRGERVVGGGWIEKSIMQNEECRMQNAE
jgi:tRNA-specific 2-thiouridylase